MHPKTRARRGRHQSRAPLPRSAAQPSERWPALPLDAWLPTYSTLHRWAQIVGKTRLVLAPFENHWWHCALYVTVRGLGTSPMPYEGRSIDVELDVLGDELVVRTNDDETRTMRLEPKSVADFYHEYCELLGSLDVHVPIVAKPNELPDATPFAEDREHASYDGEAVRRWWSALTQADRLLKRFRGGFTGKCSPSHFWWGAFDLACTRFSGNRAPLHPGGGVPNCPAYVMHEAYSRECISAGWWPGVAGSSVAEPAFYAYIYPEPAGFDGIAVEPANAFYSRELREWVLPYDAVRTSGDPDAMVMSFLETTYLGAAELAGWDVDRLRSRAEAAFIERRPEAR
jgi:hypothetical protein